MIESEAHFLNAAGIKIAYRQWRPSGARPRAIVFISHGLGEHSGRYRHVAAALTAAGFLCYGIDHLGHGKSGGTRAYVPDAWRLVDDFAQLHDMARAEHPDLPALMLAHSMGSLIGLGFALRQPGVLRGMAITGLPTHGERRMPAWLIALCLRAARHIPKVRLSPISLPGLLTSSRDALRAWREDPLVDKGMWRIGTSAGLLLMSREISARAGEIKLPLLLLHGSADHLVPASGSVDFADSVRSADVTLRVYPGLRHELVNERERDEIIATIRDWLLARKG